MFVRGKKKEKRKSRVISLITDERKGRLPVLWGRKGKGGEKKGGQSTGGLSLTTLSKEEGGVNATKRKISGMTAGYRKRGRKEPNLLGGRRGGKKERVF